jgi:IS1 family transposase
LKIANSLYHKELQKHHSAFREDRHVVGKAHTAGIEGNNCRLRHRVRRVFRRTCCFSKSIINHRKVFDMVFFYINYGFV